MKTSLKIMLLILFFVGAVVGVLVFEKTRVAPPATLKTEDQYVITLSEESEALTGIADIGKCRLAYITLSDKIKRFCIENVADDNTADYYLKKSADIYGNHLKEYGFRVLERSTWPKDTLDRMLGYMAELRSVQLSYGKKAVEDDILSSFGDIKRIVEGYHAALCLASNATFHSVQDAERKCAKAKEYKTARYLSNNIELRRTLDEFPRKMANSHRAYIRVCVDSLGLYENMTEDEYNDLKKRVDNVIKRYENIGIYGSSKQKIDDLKQKSEDLAEWKASSWYRSKNSSKRI